MDKQAKEIQQEVPNAKVERQGEGIIVTFDSNVLFGFDKSDLTSTAKTTVNDLNTILQKYPDENVMVIGHTDDVGTDSYNQQLSERRAASVATYLEQQGVAASRISTKGMGESDPKVPNDTEANRAQNRRVEFVLTASDKMKQEAKQGTLN
jgi:outer membrane protein OmpA-like peptidoglycan-associated protein